MSKTVCQLLLLCVLTLTAMACGSATINDPGPAGRVQVKLNRPGYATGDTIELTVTNVSQIELVYPVGFCRTLLQREQGDAWSTVNSPAEGCPLALSLLGAGQSTLHLYVVPRDLPTGYYRLVMPLPIPRDAPAPDTSLVSPTFVLNAVTLRSPGA